jgi:pilus assembly protein CpaC
MKRSRHLTVTLSLLLASAAMAQTADEMRLTVGRSVVLDFPADVRQISTSDPAIVDAVAVSTREVLLHAKAVGTATVVIWPRTGERTVHGITVEQNLDPLRRLLKDTFPGENIQVQSSRDAISLTGSVSAKEIAERAALLATPYGKNIVANLNIAPPSPERQVLLRVKFAEIDRRATQSLGINILSTGAANTPGRVTTGQFSPPNTAEVAGSIPGGITGTRSEFSVSDALNIFAFRPDLNLAAFIRALQAESLLQILAEPNLVTTEGREASFLVGGEFPIPVLQGGSNAGAITIQFREFGIRLSFTPVITAQGSVKMHVRPEVSTIDLNNAVSVSGFLVPALATRRMETNVELREGQSFAIAGLIDNRVQESLNKIPGLGSIPLLGALFKSKEISKNLSELVVIVTPEITTASTVGDQPMVPVMPREFMQPFKPEDANQSDEKQKQSKAGELDKSVRPAAKTKRGFLRFGKKS